SGAFCDLEFREGVQQFAVRGGRGFQFAVVELDEAVGEVEIFVIVGDDEDGFAAGFQLGQELGVEDGLEMGVLVGGPFVEEIERTVFEIGGEEGEALALALGNRDGGKSTVADSDFVVEMEAGEVFASLRVEVRIAQTQHAFEEIKIREDGGEQ